MPQPRKAAVQKDAGKVVQLVPLSHEGKPIPADANLRDVLPADVLAACVERGEAGAE